MITSLRLLLVGSAALGVAACSSTCKSGDLTCALASMTWTDFGVDGGSNAGFEGPVQPLVDVSISNLEALAGAGGGGCGSRDGGADAGPLPSCGGQLLLAPVSSPVVFDGTGPEGSLVGLEWTDPSGCLPAFCMSACPKGGQCIGARCSPSIHDGIGEATTLHWVTYNAPDGSDFTLRIIAVSAPGCPADVSTAINDGLPGLTFSPPILIEMQITDLGIPATTGGGTSGGSTTGSGGSCPGGGFEASTVSCTPLGITGSPDTCVTAAEYANSSGFPLPVSCAVQGTQGCIAADGFLAKPCCVGLRCLDSPACGGGSVPGGVCLQ